MTSKTVNEVFIGQTETGFVAISVEAPFFCFEADTEAAVEEKAKKALHFYRQQKAAPVAASAAKKRTLTLSTFVPWKTVSINDMVAA